jgi:hypothetical protein
MPRLASYLTGRREEGNRNEHCIQRTDDNRTTRHRPDGITIESRRLTGGVANFITGQNFIVDGGESLGLKGS